MSALDKAIKAAGSARKLSLALGVTSMSVSHWKNRDHGVVPPTHILPIFKMTGVTPTNYAQISIQIPLMVYLNRSLNNANFFISTE